MLAFTEIDRKNFRHLYADVIWYGIFYGSTLAFLTIYAARLGASSLEIGLFTSGPAVMNLLFSLPASFLLQRWPSTKATFLSSALTRIGYAVPILLPLMAGAAVQIWVLVIISLLSAIPGTMLAIGANAMVAEVVPLDWRAQVVGRRVALSALFITVTTLFSGWLLTQISFPLNYQLVFGLGLIGAAMSSYQLALIRPRRVVEPGNGAKDRDRFDLSQVSGTISQAFRSLVQSGSKGLLRLDLLKGSYGPFMLAYLAFYMAVFIAVPLLPLFWVRDLKLPDLSISLGNSLFYATMFIISMLLPRLSRRFSQKWVFIVSATAYSLYPLLTGLARGPILFYIASIAGGAAWGVAAGASINRLMERVPEDDRPAHMALHNLALNLGILVGAMAGPWLGDFLGLRTGLLVAGAVRLLSGLLLILWG
jgi:MFS family permease